MTAARALRLRLGPREVELSTEQDELRLAIGHLYRPFATEELELPASRLPREAPVDTEVRATVDGEDFRFSNLAAAVRGLDEVIAEALLMDARDALLLHASAVAGEDRTLLFVGPSGSGKTTLALVLVRRGLRYLTDEYTVVRGSVLQPFPRCAARKFPGPAPAGALLELPDAEGYRSYLLPDLRAGLEEMTMPAPRLVFPTRIESGAPSASRISTAEACTLLMKSTFAIRDRVRDLWPRVSDLAARAPACVLEYRDAQRDLDLALDLLEDS